MFSIYRKIDYQLQQQLQQTMEILHQLMEQPNHIQILLIILNYLLIKIDLYFLLLLDSGVEQSHEYIYMYKHFLL